MLSNEERQARRGEILHELAALRAEHDRLRDLCACGAETKPHFTVCTSCRTESDRARSRAEYDAAEKIPFADYDRSHVYDGDRYIDVEDILAALDEYDHDSGAEPTMSHDESDVASWYYATKDVPGPQIDAADVLENALVDYWEDDAREPYMADEDGLQALLDGWLESRKVGEFWDVDHSRVVVVLP